MSDERPEPAPEEQVAEIVSFAMDCARQGETELLARYVAGGYPVDHPDPDGNTALMLAAYHGHAGTVAALVGLGADVDRLNARNQSPLAGALFKGEVAVAAALVAAGADPDLGSPTSRETAQMFGTTHLLGPDAPCA